MWTGVGGTKDDRLVMLVTVDCGGDEACSVMVGMMVGVCRGVVAPGVVGLTVS
jgi:hypothetical protein